MSTIDRGKRKGDALALFDGVMDVDHVKKGRLEVGKDFSGGGDLTRLQPGQDQ